MRDRVVLVSRDDRHVFQPSLLWLAVGTRHPEALHRPLTGLRRKGIEIVTAEVTLIDARNRRVMTRSGTIEADALVISLGADLAPGIVPGLTDAGHNLYTLEGASAIRDALLAMKQGRVVIMTAEPAYKCPAAPYEAAMLVDDLLLKKGVRGNVDVTLFAAEPAPMGVAGATVSAAVRSMVESKGIRYIPEHQVVSVDARAKRIAFANGATGDYDLLIYVPPHRAPAAIRESGLESDAGWVRVDRQSLETRFPMVFAIGDVTTLPLTVGKPLPKAGVFAHAQAEVVAHNIARMWYGDGAPRQFDGHGQCFLETGSGRAGLGSGNFYAEPSPRIDLHPPSRWFHWLKVLFEYWWFLRWL